MQHSFQKCKPEPSLSEIPGLWSEAVAMESLAPENLRAGVARQRTRLLAGIPRWRLPEVLDQLAEAIT